MQNPEETQDKSERSLKYFVVKRMIQICLPLTLIVIAMFLIRGDWTWINGWIYLGSYILQIVINAILIRKNPEIIAARAQSHKNIAQFDKIFALLTYIVTIISPLLGALDARLQWSTMAVYAIIPAVGVYLLAGFMFGSAMAANRHFETQVRIQTERDHHVVDTGPYKVVRHPGYIAGIFQYLAFPFMIGSWYVMIPMGMMGIAIIWRTVREDQFLQKNLDGYQEYASRVKYRLIPGIW